MFFAVPPNHYAAYLRLGKALILWSEVKLVQSVVDLGTLKQVIGAAQIGFDDLRPLQIGGFNGLFVLRKFKDMKVYQWLRLNELLANLGYSAVFVDELERLQYLSASLDQAQEFYQDFSQDFWQDPLLDCRADSDHIFSPTNCPKGAQSAGLAGAEIIEVSEATAVSEASEFVLRQRLLQALQGIARPDSLAGPAAASVNSSDDKNDDQEQGQRQASGLGYASVMRFLAGSDCALSTDAFEKAALKLDQLERIELVPLLAQLRASHRVPTVKDYQGAACEVDIEAWLEVRQDAAIEARPEPENSSRKQQIAATRAQQLIDSVQYLMLVPVPETDLVPAFFHMGGVNDMPPAHVHLALMRRWAEKYAAKPKILGLGPDSLYFYVAKPVSSSAATRLAIEHFRYCPDSVLQSLGSIGRLASEISDCDLWQFWWE